MLHYGRGGENREDVTVPKQPVKGTKQVLLELPEQLVADAKEFAAGRGETLKEVTTQALRRHMAYPPAPPQPEPERPPEPLPDVVQPERPARKPRAKK